MISINHLSFRFNDSQKLLLDDIQIKIGENEFIVITGESGCGKTTLALAMSGFLQHQNKGNISGSVLIDGKNIREFKIGEISNAVYLVQQNPENQFCTLSVKDELAFGLENQGIDPDIIKERIDWVLNVVHAEDIRNRDLRSLSGGEQQKVAIAAGLALQPKVIILDEPTAFLDIRSTKNILSVLTELREKEKLTLIIIEHKLAQILHFQPRLLNLNNGKLISCLPINNNYKLIPRKISMCKENAQNLGDPVIEIENMRIARNNKQILNIEKLLINQGEFISLHGNNGSGKTSFLYALLGLIKSECEKCFVLGKEMKPLRSSLLIGNVGIVFQNPNHQFFTDSVLKEILFPIRNFSKEEIINSDWVNELIKIFHLEKITNLHPLKLSYGQKKRLSLASVLSYQPKLLLLDEIFIGQSYEEIIFLLEQLDVYITKRSASIILVNHHPEIIAQFSTRTILFENGRIAADQKNILYKPAFEKPSKQEKDSDMYVR